MNIRYSLLSLLLLTLMLLIGQACNQEASVKRRWHILRPTNPTRLLVNELEDDPSWYRYSWLLQPESRKTVPNQFMKPALVTRGETHAAVLVIRDRLFVNNDIRPLTGAFINGKKASLSQLEQLSPDHVAELIVLHQWDYTDAKPADKPWLVLVQTSSRPVPVNPFRQHYFTYLEAAALTEYPQGRNKSFTMNELLEATFFHRKDALVERTKDEHLKLYDELANDVDIQINGLAATPADVRTVHVREVKQVIMIERPYTAWFKARQPQHRYVLFLDTAPNRAQRDSSYYVFSPFYSGDF